MCYDTVGSLPWFDYRRQPYEPVTIPDHLTRVVEERFALVQQKGEFPYEWFDSLDRMVEEALPSMECFNSKLTEQEMSPESYAHADRMWKTFGMKRMLDYHDLYLVTDVLLLVDVLTVFRDNSLTHYNLDPFHFYTLPGFAWESMLLMTEIELEQLSDPNMYLFVEDGTRGGISVISEREADANVPGTANYNPEKPAKHIIYLDANNQYGWAMSQPLPYKDFAWLSTEELLKFRVEGSYIVFCYYHFTRIETVLIHAYTQIYHRVTFPFNE